MIHYDWNKEKNQWLKKERGISFEQIQAAIESGGLLDTVPHPNQQRYQNQKIMVVKLDNYIYLVPYVRDEEKVFLKTIIPNRKATKKYLRKEEA